MTTASTFCRNWCYSNIDCQYWQYSKEGCFVEDNLFRAEYPLTVPSGATYVTNNEFQLGEYIQHYCPPDTTPTSPPLTTPAPPVFWTTAMLVGSAVAALAVLLIVCLVCNCMRNKMPKKRGVRKTRALVKVEPPADTSRQQEVAPLLPPLVFSPLATTNQYTTYSPQYVATPTSTQRLATPTTMQYPASPVPSYGGSSMQYPTPTTMQW